MYILHESTVHKLYIQIGVGSFVDYSMNQSVNQHWPLNFGLPLLVTAGAADFNEACVLMNPQEVPAGCADIALAARAFHHLIFLQFVP